MHIFWCNRRRKLDSQYDTTERYHVRFSHATTREDTTVQDMDKRLIDNGTYVIRLLCTYVGVLAVTVAGCYYAYIDKNWTNFTYGIIFFFMAILLLILDAKCKFKN